VKVEQIISEAFGESATGARAAESLRAAGVGP
jgi:hypothetical protein